MKKISIFLFIIFGIVCLCIKPDDFVYVTIITQAWCFYCYHSDKLLSRLYNLQWLYANETTKYILLKEHSFSFLSTAAGVFVIALGIRNIDSHISGWGELILIVILCALLDVALLLNAKNTLFEIETYDRKISDNSDVKDLLKQMSFYQENIVDIYSKRNFAIFCCLCLFYLIYTHK